MDSTSKSSSKKQQSYSTSYNPLNLLLNSRRRTESENSATTNSQNCDTGSQFGSLQRQTSKNGEEYLWMMQFIYSDADRFTYATLAKVGSWMGDHLYIPPPCLGEHVKPLVPAVIRGSVIVVTGQKPESLTTSLKISIAASSSFARVNLDLQ